MTAPIEYRSVVRLSLLVQRLTQHNPGLFTGPGTNTHLVGRSALYVLDPGEDLGDGHLDRIVHAVAGRPVAAIIPSHGHLDHWPLAPRLSATLGAPIWFFEPTQASEPTGRSPMARFSMREESGWKSSTRRAIAATTCAS